MALALVDTGIHKDLHPPQQIAPVIIVSCGGNY
jgi:hypothetical protein